MTYTLESDPMRSMTRLARILLLPLLLLWLPACDDDAVGPGVFAREIGVVVNSTDISLTIFDVDDPASFETVGLGPDGSPVSLAVRGRYAVVPLGIVPAVAVVALDEAELVRTVGLPQGSGATGAAFVNDSIVLVANPGLGTVTPVNVRAGTAGAEVDVGRYPQAVVVHGGRVYVLNAELENFAPAGPSTVTVLDAETLTVLDTIELSGENAGAGAIGTGGRLYVVQAGRFGEDDGALSVVDLAGSEEVAFVDGFGGFPGSVAVGVDGLVYVGGFGVGVLVWDPATAAFTRGVDNPVAPGGLASTSGLGVDADGRVYALGPDCQNPSVAHRLGTGFASEITVQVGICPLAIGFTVIEETP